MKKLLLILLLLPVFTHAQIITTFAGCGIGDDSVATKSELFGPDDVAADSAGNIYIADYSNFRIRKVNTSGIISTIAGTGVFGCSGDSGPAINAQISGINGIAADNAGNVYIADRLNERVRKISASGIITTIAGTGVWGHTGDGGLATAAEIRPWGVAVDGKGNVYVSDSDNIRMINTAGIINTVAGNGMQGYGGDHGPATSAMLHNPWKITVDKPGNLYIGDEGNFVVRKVDTAGIITTIAGDGYDAFSGDGGPALAAGLGEILGITTDTAGNVIICDFYYQHVRKIDITTGIITTIAGDGIAGFSGDGRQAEAAEFSSPNGVACDGLGNLYIDDSYNNRIRKVNLADSIITTAAGQSGLFGEAYNAPDAEISVPDNVAVDTAGNVYFPDLYNQRIRKISTAGVITTVAGSGISGYFDSYSGDGGPATAAHLYYPSAVFVDAPGNIYIADQNNNRIRKVNNAGIITTIAGNGTAGFTDGGLATASEMMFPSGVAVDTAGNVYVADYGNSRIRKITTAGIIHSIAGNGTAGYGGDGSLATMAEIQPIDVAVDLAGNIYIADGSNNRIRKIDTGGIITTIAGNGVAGYTGDGGGAITAEINSPGGVKVDGKGNVYFSDYSNRIRMIDTAGIIHTIAGNGTPGFSGDGGTPAAAEISNPAGIAIDATGNVYIADAGNYRIRKISNNLSVPTVNKTTGNITLYPNPATIQLTIQSTNEPIKEFTVTNLLGQTVHNSQLALGSQRLTISIADLPTGVYFVKVNGEVRKFVKE